jgi:hypothetical protein
VSENPSLGRSRLAHFEPAEALTEAIWAVYPEKGRPTMRWGGLAPLAAERGIVRPRAWTTLAANDGSAQ